MNSRKRIWIHLANSPHVLVLRPIMKALDAQGHELLVTCRDFAQTVQLACHYGVPHQVVEKHAGSGLFSKAPNLLASAISMARWGWGKQIDIAISHNSYSHALASRLLRIPFVTMMDYEYQAASHLSFRLANRVLVPKCLPDDILESLGAKQTKLRKYDGFKEQIYLSDFKPDPDFPLKTGVVTDKVLLVMRPPATMALYHQFENPLFDRLLRYLGGCANVEIIMLPRTPEQAETIRDLGLPNLRIPKEPLDGPNLLYWADLVISAGGTMNREAAVLGVPTYTIYAGRIGAVDQALIEQGRIRHLTSEHDFDSLVLEKRQRSVSQILQNPILLPGIIGHILSEEYQ